MIVSVISYIVVVPWPWPWFNPHPSGCIGPHFDCILICFELPPLLPPRWFPSLASPCWLCSSSLYMDDLDLSWTLEPPSAKPVKVCASDPFVSQVQASGIFFHWVCRPYCVVQFWLWPLHLLLCPSRKCPRCSFAICDEQRSVFLLVLLLEAIHLLCTEGLMGLLLRTTSSSPLG